MFIDSYLFPLQVEYTLYISFYPTYFEKQISEG